MFGPHPSPGRGGCIGIADEVQDSVDQEQCELPSQRVSMFFGLARSGIDRDDDIAEEMRLGNAGPSLLRKSQDVGGTIVL